MKWIQSNGGPLVLIPRVHLDVWHGIEREVGDSMTHYDRACAVEADVAVLRVQGIDVLVLGDEPFSTAWVPEHNGGLLVRWVYADSEKAIIDSIRSNSLSPTLMPNGVSFPAAGPCRLFDAAEPGAHILGHSLDLDLVGGQYAVTSAMVSPSRDLRLLVHRLLLRD